MGIKDKEPRRSDLTEISGSMVIPHEFIDANGHVNNASYLIIYERARADYFLKASGMTMEEARAVLGIRSFIVELGLHFKKPILEGEQVEIFTAAEIVKHHIEFSQRITKDGADVSDFNCKICIVDDNGMPQRLPDRIKDIISQANLRI